MPNVDPSGAHNTPTVRSGPRGGGPQHRDVPGGGGGRGIPRPPSVNPISAPNLHIGQTRRELQQGQRAGRRAVTSQMAGIYMNLNRGLAKQGRFYDKSASRIEAGLVHDNMRSASFTKQIVRSAKGDRLIQGARLPQAMAGARLSQGTAQVSAKQNRADIKAVDKFTKGAGKKADSAQRQTQSITDVLTAENKSANAQFTANLKLQQAQMNLSAQQTNAQMQHDFAMAQYQAELDRKNAVFQQKLATGQIGSAGMQQVRPAVNSMISAAPEIMKYIQDNPGADATTIASYLVSQGLVSQTDAQSAPIMKLIYNLTHNTQPGADSWSKDIVDALRTTIPQWATLGQGKKDHLKEMIQAQIQSAQSQADADRLKHQSDTGGGDSVANRKVGITTPSGLTPAQEQRRTQQASSGLESARAAFIKQALQLGYSRPDAERMADLRYPDNSGAQV